MQVCFLGLLRTFAIKSAPEFNPGYLAKRKSQMAEDSPASTAKLEQVPDVDIEDGRFKYVLIKVYDTKEEKEKSKFVVRGYKWAGYHSDIYEQVDEKLHKMGLDCECVGGGRIFHDVNNKSIVVYGYSQGYGKADHSISTDLLKKHYPHYEDIKWSNEGY